MTKVKAFVHATDAVADAIAVTLGTVHLIFSKKKFLALILAEKNNLAQWHCEKNNLFPIA